MKNLMITAGTLVMIIAFISFQFRLNGLSREKSQLKFAADEAAATAALCIEAGFSGMEGTSADQAVIEEDVGKIINLNLKGKEVKYTIEFFTSPEGRPSVSVKIISDRTSAFSVRQCASRQIA